MRARYRFSKIIISYVRILFKSTIPFDIGTYIIVWFVREKNKCHIAVSRIFYINTQG